MALSVLTGMIDVGAGFQAQELVTLALLVAGFVPVIIAARQYGTRWFFVGYTMLVLAGFATVLETAVLPSLLNLVEHGSVLLAAVFFLFTAYWSHLKSEGHPRDWRDML